MSVIIFRVFDQQRRGGYKTSTACFANSCQGNSGNEGGDCKQSRWVFRPRPMQRKVWDLTIGVSVILYVGQTVCRSV